MRLKMQREAEMSSEKMDTERKNTGSFESLPIVSETMIPVAFPSVLCAPHSSYQNW